MTCGKTFHIFTTGCKANQWDSHVLAEKLEHAGLIRLPAESADLVVINACSLTRRAETDARRIIQRVRQVNPAALVALVGCHAQAYPTTDFGSDLVLGQAEKFEIDRYGAEKGRFVGSTRSFPMEKTAIISQRDRTRFFFKIQDGCDRFCTYCIVPYARGHVRSRPAEDVATTMKALKNSGVKEVVLTGIDIAAYRDPVSGTGLKDLLLMLDGFPTPPRIRLSSVAPDYMDSAFIDVFAASKKIAKSVHIPVQSGSDRVLEGMGRGYDGPFIADVVRKLKRNIPAVGIGMDIMAGFPGEDEAAFMETCAFIEGLDISYLHVFPYSERPGTRASAFGGKVAEAVKRRRVKELKRLDARKREAFARHHLGKRVCIIPEARMYAGGFMRGFSDNYLPVYIPYEKGLENNLVEVTITDMQESRLLGGLTCS